MLSLNFLKNYPSGHCGCVDVEVDDVLQTASLLYNISITITAATTLSCPIGGFYNRLG